MHSIEILQSKIIQQLKVISAPRLQLLAEEMAIVRDPDRYGELYGAGINRESQSVSGWPDAGVVCPSNGSIDGVEATRSKDWKRHLRDDLENAKSSEFPTLNGFLFVAGYPDPEPGYDEIAEAKRGFIELGLPDRRIHILVGNGLVRELLQPRYARILSTVLGVAREPEHFRLLVGGVGSGRKAFEFEPDENEYANNEVFHPAIFDDVNRRLRNDGCALVLGRGAAGKTVLGRLIAADRGALPSWYLDLKWVQDVAETARGAVLNSIIEFGGDGVLFIIDNAHLAEDLAISIYQEWLLLGHPSGSQLLLLCREIRRRGREPLGETQLNPLILRAQRDAVRGVYRRILKRGTNIANPAEPPTLALNQWLRTFGGDPTSPDHSVDLVSFSAAVSRKKHELSAQDWTLSEADASAEVRDRCLVQLRDGERRNLLRLASLPDDVALPFEALVDRYEAFSTSIENGIVFEITRYTRSESHYMLAHAALGRLLRIANGSSTIDREAECREVAKISSFSGFYVARQAWRNGEADLARMIFRAAAESPRWLWSIRGFNHVSTFLDLSNLIGEPLWSERDVATSEVRGRFLDLAFEGDLHTLVTFLRSIAAPSNAAVTPLCDALIADLSDTRNHDRWLEAVSKADLYSLIHFLRYAVQKRSGLAGVHRKLITDLSGESERERWMTRLEHADIGGLMAFLKFADNHRNNLLPVRGWLVSVLGADERAQWLFELALRSPLDFLVAFLSYTRLPGAGVIPLRNNLVGQLCARSNRHQILTRVMDRTYRRLASFIQYVSVPEHGLAALYTDLVAELRTDERLTELAFAACIMPLTDFISLLDAVPFADELAARIDGEVWRRQRSAERRAMLDAINNIRSKLKDIGRPDLLPPCARAQIRVCAEQRVRMDNVYLHHIGSVLAFSVGVDPHVLHDFVVNTITVAWLERQYEMSRPTTIAIALISIAFHLPEFLHAKFNTGALTDRLERELDNMASSAFKVEVVGQTLELLGAAALIGVKAEHRRWKWPSDAEIRAALAMLHAESEQGSWHLVRVWIGLREMMRLKESAVTVEGRDVDGALKAWRGFEPATPFVARLNSSMIDWLERCEDLGWTLVHWG